MKIGVRAFAWTTKLDESHLRLFPLIREHGIDAFQAPRFDPAGLVTNSLRRTLAASGLQRTMSPEDISFQGTAYLRAHLGPEADN
jgi:hypothetical protein